MPQKLLVTTLIAVQLLSWSGSSLYLCLCGHTSCVDFGPATCHCCHSQSDRGDTWCAHNSCGEEDHFADGGTVVRSSDSCNCAHVQISIAPAPTVIDSASPAQGHVQAVFATLPAGTTREPRDSLGADYPAERGGSSQLILLASVVLRC